MNEQQNPYAAPTAATTPPVFPQQEVPEDIRKKIKGGWVAALISGLITLAFVLFAISTGNSMLGLDVWALLDVALILGMAFGIYKKSRTCALIMLIYFVGSKIIMMMDGNGFRGILVALLFIYYFFQAVVGTFQYHRWKKGLMQSPMG